MPALQAHATNATRREDASRDWQRETVAMARFLRPLLSAALLWIPLGGAAAPDFSTFQTQFRQALAQPDGKALAALTRMPFLFEGRPHDAAAFVHKVWPRLFTPALRRCLRETPAQAEAPNERVVFCRPYAFYFEARSGRWQLREFGADGED